MIQHNNEIAIFSHHADNVTHINHLSEVLRYLRTKKNVKLADVSGGGEVISQLCREKLIDELRLNISGQLCGSLNTEGQHRSTLFPSKDYVYTPTTTPLVKHKQIRVFNDDFIFLRSGIQYRH